MRVDIGLFSKISVIFDAYIWLNTFSSLAKKRMTIDK